MDSLLEVIEKNGEPYWRIDPATVDLSKMTEVHKVAEVFAYCVEAGEQIQVETKSNGIIETVNTAYEGDWVVYNIEEATGGTLKEKLQNAYIKVIKGGIFETLYDLKLQDSEDNADDANSIRGDFFTHTSNAIFMAMVPFNFFISAPWGGHQFIPKGGFIVYNTRTRTPEHPDIYGTSKEQGLQTYSKAHDNNEKVLRDVYKYVIMCDRSPISEIQFNNRDLERAYEKIGHESLWCGHRR